MSDEPIKTCVERQLAGEQLIEAARIAREINPENAPHIIAGTPVGNTNQDGRFSQALLTGKKWSQNTKITISFLRATVAQQDFIKRIAKEWFDLVNLQVQWVSSAGNIRIVAEQGGGSWSYLGTDCLAIRNTSQPTMHFGWLDEAVVRHEFGHGFIGMIHEHQHPRSSIPWDEAAVYNYYTGPPNNWTREETYLNVLSKYAESQTNFSAYDRASIMQYAVDNRLTIGDWSVGWNSVLSDADRLFAQAMYPKIEEPAPETKQVWQLTGRWWEGRADGSLAHYPASDEFGSGAYRTYGWYENRTVDSPDIVFHPPRG